MKVIICGLYYLDVDEKKANSGAALWTLNDFYHFYPHPWFKPDRIYQIHHDFPREVNQMRMHDWIEQYKRFPDSEIIVTTDYGFENQKFFNPFSLLNAFGEMALTSSISMMIGDAILSGFDEIEILGVRMATNGEYAYQAPGVKYMISEARRMGVNIKATFENEWGEVDYKPKGNEIIYGGVLNVKLNLEGYENGKN